MSAFQLNRNAFKAHTANEASDHSAYYKGMHWKDRLLIAAYLNSIAFNYPQEHPPKMDKTKFMAKSR